MDDGQIVALFLRRDETAVSEAAKAYGAYCRALALRILGDSRDAEECWSDALFAAWTSIPPNEPQALGAYLAKLTRNLALKRRRDAHRLKRGGSHADLVFEELDACLPSRADVERELEDAELTRATARFLHSLPETERRIFLGRYWNFNSISELCDLYGFTDSKVKSMLSRIRKKLKHFLIKEGIFFEN